VLGELEEEGVEGGEREKAPDEDATVYVFPAFKQGRERWNWLLTIL
jgi:hypothetical protein